MNAYTTRGQARMQLHDVSAVLRSDGLPAGAALATLEWHRGYQADAEVAGLLRQHDGITPHASAPRARLSPSIASSRSTISDRWPTITKGRESMRTRTCV